MIKSAATARTHQGELDPIDRLEDKIKRLVDLIAQMRADQAKAAEANARLGQEITALRARLARPSRRPQKSAPFVTSAK
jgi:regulator of replication initiation timing